MRYILITIFLLCFPILALGDEKLKDENFIDLSAKDTEVKKVKKKDNNFEKKPLKMNTTINTINIVNRKKLSNVQFAHCLVQSQIVPLLAVERR